MILSKARVHSLYLSPNTKMYMLDNLSIIKYKEKDQ